MATPAIAHVSERGLVLLLPTGAYMLGGVLAVVATITLTVLLPPELISRVFAKGRDFDEATPRNSVPSLVSFGLLMALVLLGLFGPRDPLENLLPLSAFTLWWILFPFAIFVVPALWSVLNPWSGLASILSKNHKPIPKALGVWPAMFGYTLLSVYALSDIAPADPARLAYVVAGYWAVQFVLCLRYGPQWLRHGEGLTVFFKLIAKIALLRGLQLQFPGRDLVHGKPVKASLAIFAVSVLALGSFDGLNETFWWMGQIGINPLEFPGRSAVVWQNRIGMLGAIILLNLVVALAIWLGLLLIGKHGQFTQNYPMLALSVLPIALAYHFAHYLTAALVDLQYFWIALSDPLQMGANLLGAADTYVTTGFFNKRGSVQIIWLAQGGAIVLGHMLAVFLAHAIALNTFKNHKLAVISQLPFAAFMVVYTFFGLWLLSSPTAV